MRGSTPSKITLNHKKLCLILYYSGFHNIYNFFSLKRFKCDFGCGISPHIVLLILLNLSYYLQFSINCILPLITIGFP